MENVTIVQALLGNPTGEYDLPEYALALFDYIVSEIARVYWNRNQTQFSTKYGDDPGLEGIEMRAYYWGEDLAEASKPNFVFDGLEIRWYKYIGRGMTCNKTMSPTEWAEWFAACLSAIRQHDRD